MPSIFLMYVEMWNNLFVIGLLGSSRLEIMEAIGKG